MKAVSRLVRFARVVAIAFYFTTMVATDARGQGLLYSFETPGNLQEGWTSVSALNLGVSTEAATNGTHSLRIETPPNFVHDAFTGISNGTDPTRYSLWNNVAASLSNFTLDFDVITTADSFAHITPTGTNPYFFIDVAVNSDSPNFPQAFNVSPNIMNQIGTFPVSIPMTQLPVAQNSSFYQLWVGSNGTFTSGINGEGVRYFVDNIRFRVKPQQIAQTIFSWETPDNPNTTSVDERFEGWTEGFQTGHTHSIVTSPDHGPTDGTHALNIHRVDLGGPTFTWGSQYVLDSTPNGGPVDPAIQQQINSLAAKIEGANRIAFDVSFDPNTYDASPTFAKFGLSISDNANFFQNEFAFFNPGNYSGPTTLTMELPLSAFTSGSLNLAQQGIADNTDFLRFTISTNVNGLVVEGQPAPIDFQIDNFRLITELSGVPADYNNNGVVDAADYVVWRTHLASPTYQLLNEVQNTTAGIVTNEDYTAWKARFGNSAAGSGAIAGGTAVPEPSGIVLLLCGLIGGLGLARRHD